MDFDEWIDSIEKSRKNWFDMYTIKDLLAEASIKYGQKNSDLSQQQIDQIYADWIGEEVLCLEKEEFLLILKDMMEAEKNPIAECAECDRDGRVCYENDGGLSHRMS